MTQFDIRPYQGSDLDAIYRICLQTGDAGQDATGTIDAELLGHYFAAPYAVLEPDLAWVATADESPCGYIVGTADSEAFAAIARERWFAPLTHRYPARPRFDGSPDARMIRSIHAGYRAPAFASDYPAHLHINLLPIAQGQGMGGKLMDTFCRALQTRQVAGVHFGVDRRNERALRFYPKLGFEIIDNQHPTAVFFGMKLSQWGRIK